MLSSTLVCGEMMESIGFTEKSVVNLLPFIVMTKIFNSYPKLKNSVPFVCAAMVVSAVVQFALVKLLIDDNKSGQIILSTSIDAFQTAWFAIFLGNYIYVGSR